MQNRAGAGILCAMVAAALYGLMPNCVRAAYEGHIPAPETIMFRTAVIAVVLGIAGLLRGEVFRISKVAAPAFAAQATATFVVSVSYLMSVQYIPVGLAVVIFFTFPVLIMLVSPVVEGHAPSVRAVLVAGLAFIGLAVALGSGFAGLDLRGVLLAASASFGAALQFFSGRELSRHMTPAAFASMVHLTILPLTAIVAYAFSDGHLAMLPGGDGTREAVYFMCGAAIIYVGGYLLQMMSLRFAPASTVAPFYNLEPIVSILVAALLLGERLALAQYAGGGLVLVALVLANVVARKDSGA